MELWCPFALKKPIKGHPGAGPFSGGAPKIGHHTTEGDSIAGAEATYLKTGNLPHFTDTFEAGVYAVHQHLALDIAGTALKHLSGTVETNRDDVIQIEHVGRSVDAHQFAAGYLAGIARLSRWIESQTGCPATSTATFKSYPDSYGFKNGVRLSPAEWLAYSGHLGHQHVPNNEHGDPGGLDIAAILADAHQPSPAAFFIPQTLEEADVIVVDWPGSPDDKGRMPFVKVDRQGNTYNLNGAPEFPALADIGVKRDDIVGAELVDGELVLYTNEVCQEPDGSWNAATFALVRR